jgi:hypothetical protein
MRTFGAFLLAALFLAALFVVAPAANAQSLDLSKITCKEFLDSDKTRKDLIIAWLDGYYLDQNTMGPVMKLDCRRPPKTIRLLYPEPGPRRHFCRRKNGEIAKVRAQPGSARIARAQPVISAISAVL